MQPMAAEVCRQVRAIAGLDEWFDAMLTVYKEAIAEPATEADRQAQFCFAAECLQQFVSLRTYYLRRPNIGPNLRKRPAVFLGRRR